MSGDRTGKTRRIHFFMAYLYLSSTLKDVWNGEKVQRSDAMPAKGSRV